MPERRFSDADLGRWAERGLISAQQREAILRDLAAQPPSEVEGGLTLTTLLYYSGGLLVLVAYSIFLGFQWEAVNPAGRVVIAALSLAFFAAVSEVLLRMERFRVPGELLQLVAIAIVPLLTFAVLDAADLWPDDPGYTYLDDGREGYWGDLAWARMALGGATFAAAALAFARSRSPYVLIVAIGSLTSVFVDASMRVDFHGEYAWDTAELMIVAGMGAAALAGGYLSRGRTGRDYTTWLYLGGLAGLAIGLGVSTFPDNAGDGWGALWMVAALAVLGLAIPLQQRLFAAAGLAAVFAYLGKLVFDVFASANAALVLVVLGLLVLGLGMLYQRYNERLFQRPLGT
ncbi:MAG: DUF2157 domain-containing protein [Chloroflexi bacterium]|nr:DUF2157 domain-containing protein [Chloroflexota bacterium]